MSALYLFCILTFGQGIFLAGYIIVSGKGKTLPKTLLALIILIEVLTLYDEVLLYFSDNNLPILLYYVGTPLMAAMGPLLLAYIYFSINHSYTLKAHYAFHLLPAAIAVVFAVINYHLMPYEDKIDYITFFQHSLTTIDYTKPLLEQIINNLFRLYTLAYILVAWMLVHRSRSKLRSRVSEGFIKFLLSGITFLLVASFLIELIPPSGFSSFRFGSYLIIFSSHIYGLTLLHFRPPARLVQADKYQRSGLKTDEEQVIINKLNELFEQQQIFKNPILTLQKLASEAGTNSHYLSQVLNTTYNKSFNEFVNSYRIAHAKQLLDNTNGFLSIDDIALSSGFASPSTFYRIFKQETGLTPRQFQNH